MGNLSFLSIAAWKPFIDLSSDSRNLSILCDVNSKDKLPKAFFNSIAMFLAFIKIQTETHVQKTTKPWLKKHHT